MDFLFKGEGYKLIGAGLEVYNQMGSGFLEEVYQECLELELSYQNIPSPQMPLELWYKGQKMKKYYKPDLFVFKELIVALQLKRLS
jgi:GxxExxY protein